MDVSLSLPDFSWWYLLLISGLYGFITHLVSLPGFHKYNATRKYDKELYDPATLLIICLIRIVFALPIRLFWLCCGIVGIILVSPASGQLHLMPFKKFYRWYKTPEEIDDMMESRPK